jgi:hypothetical protein
MRCLRRNKVKQISVRFDETKQCLFFSCSKHIEAKTDDGNCDNCIDLTRDDSDSNWRDSVVEQIVARGMVDTRFSRYSQSKFLVYKEFLKVD